jgi:hypothetical protein
MKGTRAQRSLDGAARYPGCTNARVDTMVVVTNDQAAPAFTLGMRYYSGMQGASNYCIPPVTHSSDAETGPRRCFRPEFTVISAVSTSTNSTGGLCTEQHSNILTIPARRLFNARS